MRIRNLMAFVCLACATAWADDITIELDSSQLTAEPGQQVTFSGVIVNDDYGVVDLNDISVTLDGMFTVDTSPFFSGPATVDASTPSVASETPDFDIFNVLVNVPYTDPAGVQSGTLTILGGEETNGYDPTTENDLGSASFSVNVVEPTPEASTFTLILVGAVLVFVRKAWMSREFIQGRVNALRSNT